MLRGMIRPDPEASPPPGGDTPPPPSPVRPDSWPDAPKGDSAPWLTQSAWAQPLTTESGTTRRAPRSRRRRVARRLFFFAVALLPLSFLIVLVAVYGVAHSAEPHKADAIVVLGAAQYNGHPTDVFRARLDRALELYQAGYAPLVVMTGGNMPGDVYTEAETGEAYLLQRGVPQSAIVWENTSRNTWDNIAGADAVMQERGVHSVLIVSDGFHLLRAELIARHFGYRAYGAASTDSPITPWSGNEFSYAFRETAGIYALVPRVIGLG